MVYKFNKYYVLLSLQSVEETMSSGLLARLEQNLHNLYMQSFPQQKLTNFCLLQMKVLQSRRYYQLGSMECAGDFGTHCYLWQPEIFACPMLVLRYYKFVKNTYPHHRLLFCYSPVVLPLCLFVRYIVQPSIHLTFDPPVTNGLVWFYGV